MENVEVSERPFLASGEDVPANSTSNNGTRLSAGPKSSSVIALMTSEAVICFPDRATAWSWELEKVSEDRIPLALDIRCGCRVRRQQRSLDILGKEGLRSLR